MVFNYNSIQAAIDDADTISGDTIWLGNSTYSENVTINKNVIIRPITDVDVTIQALNTSQPVLTINSDGNGTTIRDLIITGSTSSAGIYINNSTDNYILGNTITGNNNGIYLSSSSKNLISGNEISSLSSGIIIINGSDNKITGNNITDNSIGINIISSNDNGVYGNNIYNNNTGIVLYNSSTEIQYNRIAGNTAHGLTNIGNGTVDATNNWWGSNNPITPSDIYITGGTVTYDPWLILTINSSTDRSDRSGDYYNYLITADVTHNNQGADTSSDGNIPDDIPIYFNTTLGTINSSATTKKGKAELTLSATSAGTANVSASLDDQTVSQLVDITSIDVLGVYNTRTQESFATIQEAVTDVDTQNGDTITIAEGIYTENIAIHKKLTIQPVTGAKVIVKADDTKENPDDENKSAIFISNGGNGSTIEGINIVGTFETYGISVSNAFNVNINNNTITGCNRGIYLYQSGNNTINENIVEDNYYGITIYESYSNQLTENIIKNNQYGIDLFKSDYNEIIGNNINSNYKGIYLYDSNLTIISENDITNSWIGTYIFESNNNVISNNNFNDNGVGITNYDSIGNTSTGNTFSNSLLSDTSIIDSNQMVIAANDFSCGPAALATVLKNLGIMTTEAEIANLSETDITGTSLLGLKTAAIYKGATAIGVRINADSLQTNYIVVISVNGENHFDIVQNLTSNTVTLIDPNLGVIQLTREQFNDIYTGVALIINGSAPPGAIELTDDEMQDIKANGYYWQYQYSIYRPYIYFAGWGYQECSYTSRYTYFDFHYWIWVNVSITSWFSVPYPIFAIGYEEYRIYGLVYVEETVDFYIDQYALIMNMSKKISAGILVAGFFTPPIPIGAALSTGAVGLGLAYEYGQGRGQIDWEEIFYIDPWLTITKNNKSITIDPTEFEHIWHMYA